MVKQRSRAVAGREPSQHRDRRGPSVGSASGAVDHRESGLESLQGSVGNRVVGEILGFARPISRSPDTPLETIISSAGGDPDFNADRIVNDLRRAINASEIQTDLSAIANRQSITRNIDVATVVRVLDALTPSQVRAVRVLYEQREGGRPLERDLFGLGASGFASNVTAPQRVRIEALLRGTKADPVTADALAGLPPKLAAAVLAALGPVPATAARLNRLEADAAEIRELVAAGVGKVGNRERIMALHRRDVADVEVMGAFYAHRFGLDLATHLDASFESRLQCMRLVELRAGRWDLADACAIEDIRQALESSISKVPDLGNTSDEIIGQLKAKALADINSIVGRNREEALKEPGPPGKSADQKVNERLAKILDLKGPEEGQTVSSLLVATFGDRAAPLVALGNQSMVEVHARELLDMEASKTTSSEKIATIMRAIRSEAHAEVVSWLSVPGLDAATKAAMAQHSEELAKHRAVESIKSFRRTYDAMRGSERSYETIVGTASEVNQDMLRELTFGGGEYGSDIGKLDIAIRSKNREMALEVLGGQVDGARMNDLENRYNATHKTSLRVELFGVSLDSDHRAGDLAGKTDNADSAETAEGLERQMMGGLLSGREATRAKESLEKPAIMNGAEEVEWIAAHGKRERDVTMANRGKTGDLREWGDVPETQQILEETKGDLAALRTMWFVASKDPARQDLILRAMRQVRVTLTGDAAAYEADNARVLEQIRAAVTFAVQVALAVALPGAGAGLVGFIEGAVVNIASSVATNMVVRGGDYRWENLKGDVIGGLIGAGGGKLGEEVFGIVASTVTGQVGKAAAQAAERAGLATALAKEAQAAGVAGADLAAFSRLAEDALKAERAGVATASTTMGKTAVGFEKVMQEGGNYVGSTAATSVSNDENGFTVEEFLKALVQNLAGKAGGAMREGRAKGESSPEGDSGPSVGASPGHDDATHTQQVPEASAPEVKAKPPQQAAQASELLALPGVGHAGPAATDGAPTARALTPGELLENHGIPRSSADGFQMVADHFDVIIKVRSTNLDSLPVLAAGGAAKPEIIKVKTLQRVDALIGGPVGHEGKPALFEPKLPPDLASMPSEQAAEVQQRYNDRLKEWNKRGDYDVYIADGRLAHEDGLLKVRDPREADGANPGQGATREVGGDHDVYDVTHADGSPLTDLQRTILYSVMRGAGINFEHGFQKAWKADSPKTYDAAAHVRMSAAANAEGVVAFAPKQGPVAIAGDAPLTTPARAPSPSDSFMPLRSAEEAGGPGPGRGGAASDAEPAPSGGGADDLSVGDEHTWVDGDTDPDIVTPLDDNDIQEVWTRPAMEEVLGKGQTGRGALAVERQGRISTLEGRPTGSEASFTPVEAGGEVRIGGAKTPVEAAIAYVHEMAHAGEAMSGRAPDAATTPQDVFVAAKLAEEARAQAASIRMKNELEADAGASVAVDVAGEDIYLRAYQEALADFETRSPDIDPDLRRQAAANVAEEQLAAAFADGRLLPSTEPNVSYTDLYRRIWANRQGR